jgi:hypothetical protein
MEEPKIDIVDPITGNEQTVTDDRIGNWIDLMNNDLQMKVSIDELFFLFILNVVV